MIEQVLQVFRESRFDLREWAHPDDSQRSLSDRVAAHRMKLALAAAIQPQSILQVGVGFGYAARALLEGCPTAAYLGIDRDRAELGGDRDNFAWARKITADFDADFLLADARSLEVFPGGEYDLVHVDGQLDGAEVYNILWKAIDQAKLILVDGCMPAEESYPRVMQFLLDRHRELEYYLFLPSSAGEVLIRVADRYRIVARQSREVHAATTSRDIRDAYDASYYLDDCGGCDIYRATGGKALHDSRLKAVFDLALPRPGERFLDLGCGRGEIAYQAARRGAEVTAVDYSADAIELTRQCFDGEEELLRRVELICSDVNDLDVEGGFDQIVTSDVVEHLHPEELDRLIARAAGLLRRPGRWVIHTAPSVWYLRRGHAGRDDTLVQDPNTAYEKLMHLHELSPADLRRRLRARFEHVLLWVSDDDRGNWIGSLSGQYSRRDYLAARGMMAIASHDPISTADVLDLLRQEALEERERNVRLEVLDDVRVAAGDVASVTLRLTNDGPRTLSSYPPLPVRLSYHWRAQEGGVDVQEGLRSPLPFPVRPGETVEVRAQVTAPPEPGRYLLQMTLVQDDVAWFEHTSPELPREVGVTVYPAGGGSR